MHNTIDHPALERYSENFSKKVLNNKSKNKINGPEILELTPLRQVNLLVVKSLLFQWKKETEKLKSPYFDFSNEEVQKALMSFMNTVSRHISVDHAAMGYLLKNATRETILLIFFPYVFYTDLINNWEEEKISLKDLRQINKYIKVNGSLMNSIIAHLDNEGIQHLNKKEALHILNDIMEHSDLAPAETEEFEAKFNHVLEFQINDLVNEEEPEEVTVGTTTQSPEAITEPEATIEEMDIAFEQEDTILPGSPESTVAPELEEDQNKEEISHIEKYPVNVEQQAPVKSTIADIHERRRIEKISKYISINQKFMFINKLFDKDWGKFEKAISFLDETNDKAAIFDYLDEHAPAWREEGDEAEEFRLVLEKKLGDPIG